MTAVEVWARYYTKDGDGETRRERNARFNQDSPTLDVPDRGSHLWEWFTDISRSRQYRDGSPQPISPTDWLAWSQMTGAIVRDEEWAILRAMDAAFVVAMTGELADQRAREADKRQKSRGRHR